MIDLVTLQRALDAWPDDLGVLNSVNPRLASALRQAAAGDCGAGDIAVLIRDAVREWQERRGSALLLAPLMLLVEIFSHVFRPISLGIRLFANMFADHQVVAMFTDMTKVVIPVIFYLLGAFVSVVQAFVFTMLTAIYIALAISHDH